MVRRLFLIPLLLLMLGAVMMGTSACGDSSEKEAPTARLVPPSSPVEWVVTAPAPEQNLSPGQATGNLYVIVGQMGKHRSQQECEFVLRDIESWSACLTTFTDSFWVVTAHRAEDGIEI